MVPLALAAEALRRDPEMFGELLRGERAAFGFQHVALHLRSAQECLRQGIGFVRQDLRTDGSGVA